MKRSPAFAKDVVARRQRGERVGLLVIALHDWNAGRWFDARPEVSRVVVPDDIEPKQVRFDVAHALDVVICGSPTLPDFYAYVSALELAGPASIWGEFDDGFWRLERSRFGRRDWEGSDGPLPVQWLAKAVHAHRQWALLRGEGLYGLPAFAAARKAAYSSLFGDGAEEMMRAVFAARTAAALPELKQEAA